jgi:hypothetical protein
LIEWGFKSFYSFLMHTLMSRPDTSSAKYFNVSYLNSKFMWYSKISRKITTYIWFYWLILVLLDFHGLASFVRSSFTLQSTSKSLSPNDLARLDPTHRRTCLRQHYKFWKTNLFSPEWFRSIVCTFNSLNDWLSIFRSQTRHPITEEIL